MTFEISNTWNYMKCAQSAPTGASQGRLVWSAFKDSPGRFWTVEQFPRMQSGAPVVRPFFGTWVGLGWKSNFWIINDVLSKKHLPSIMAIIIILFFIKMYDVIQNFPDHVSHSSCQDPHFFCGENKRTSVYTICYWDHLWGFLRWWFYFGSLHPRSLT